MQINYWMLAVGENSSSEVVNLDQPAAQTNAAATTTTQADGKQQETCPITNAKKNSTGSVVLMLVLMAVMFFFLIRGPRKQQKEAQKLRASLAKNDRVRTIGGIFGVIIDINDNEVTLKIDESNNTKIKIAIAAIASKL